MMRGGSAVLERAATSPSFLAGTMGKAERKQPGSEAKADAEQGDGAVDSAFDLWLKRGLHQLYDNVAKEPIPEDLLRMIEDDQAKKGK